MGSILTLGINWVRTSDDIPICAVGEKFVCIVPAMIEQGPLRYFVEIVTARENGWENENGFSIEDSVAWCSEYDFHKSAVRVFGPPESWFPGLRR